MFFDTIVRYILANWLFFSIRFGEVQNKMVDEYPVKKVQCTFLNAGFVLRYNSNNNNMNECLASKAQSGCDY